tara:strand:+ start:2437 stop:3699 length:1263 start_codon:yes stop_codon:yes gene_type:complete
MKNFIISLFFCFSFSEEIVDGIMAVVGDNIITKGEFFYQLSSIANQRGISATQTPLKYEKLANAVLEDIINRYVLLEYAEKDSNVVVDNDEVQIQLDNQIDMFIKSVGSVDSLETTFGKPLQQIKADYWDEIYNAMLIERFRLNLTAGFIVGKKEVESFYDIYKDSLPPSPASANFSIYNIEFTPSRKTIEKSYSFVKNLKDSIINKTSSFEAIVNNHSDDTASIPSGGKIGYTERGSLFPKYEEAAYSMKIGEISNPIITDAGHHIIKLLDKRGEKISTQHILKLILPTENDKKQTVESINSVYRNSKADPLYLENFIEELEGKNLLSGNFFNYPINRFPVDIYNKIRLSEDSFLHEPFVMQNGSISILYVYEFFPEKKATLENSYTFIESIALDKKTLDYLDSWLDKKRSGVYINTFE